MCLNCSPFVTFFFLVGMFDDVVDVDLSHSSWIF